MEEILRFPLSRLTLTSVDYWVRRRTFLGQKKIGRENDSPVSGRNAGFLLSGVSVIFSISFSMCKAVCQMQFQNEQKRQANKQTETQTESLFLSCCTQGWTMEWHNIDIVMNSIRICFVFLFNSYSLPASERSSVKPVELIFQNGLLEHIHSSLVFPCQIFRFSNLYLHQFSS